MERCVILGKKIDDAPLPRIGQRSELGGARTAQALTDFDLFDKIDPVLFCPVCSSISERRFGSRMPVRGSGMEEARLYRHATMHLRRPPPGPRGRSGTRRTEVDSDEQRLPHVED